MYNLDSCRLSIC